MGSEGIQQSFLVDTKWLCKAIDLSGCQHHDVVFIIGGDNGQLACTLAETCRIVTVEPDESIANYLYSLGLYRTTVINAEPHLVLGDIPFDKILCLQPQLISPGMLEALLRVQFSSAVMVMPDHLVAAFRARNKLGTLLRAAFKMEAVSTVPKNAFSPPLPLPSTLITIRRAEDNNAVSKSLRLLLAEAGTMRGLLTRACREFYGYTLADAQEIVRKLDANMLKKRFWDIDEEEFKDVYDWLKA